MKRSFLIGSLAVLVCLLLFPGTGWGQTGASTIRGSVKDQSGALVSGATVTLTNLETNAVRTAETTTSGAFAFERVPVGDYEVRIEAKGFRKSIVRPVQALVANVTDVPVTLEIAHVCHESLHWADNRFSEALRLNSYFVIANRNKFKCECPRRRGFCSPNGVRL